MAFNDGRPVPRKWLGKALREVVEQFGGGKLRPQSSEGEWKHEGIIYQDRSVELIVDVPDTPKNRRWMRAFRERWRVQLKQIELWLVSYRIEIE
jgi:hypothetical protein